MVSRVIASVTRSRANERWPKRWRLANKPLPIAQRGLPSGRCRSQRMR
jgi:hypothetical protein